MPQVHDMMKSLRFNRSQLNKDNAFKSDKRKRNAPAIELHHGKHSAQATFDTQHRLKKQRQKNLRIKLLVFGLLSVSLLVALYLMNNRTFF
ncbi:MAG: hypothetical protein N4A46_14485 [Schleiferiaceae bacterium]|jgi:hypothetical protein|nr:hypothetical protein [Schleiferiaceae bacterium]